MYAPNLTLHHPLQCVHLPSDSNNIVCFADFSTWPGKIFGWRGKHNKQQQHVYIHVHVYVFFSQLTQHGAINQLFSNVTWTTLPSADEAFQDLPEDSEEYQIVRQWGQPSIFVSLLLFSALHVSTNAHVRV